MSAKALVIGLDGATFDVINPLLDAGRLPNLARLKSEGVAVPLQSTYPAISAPAWTSCRTGVNPGKHGVFDFWKVIAYEWVFITSADLQVPAVEHILSRQGRRVCIINVPITYPPQPVNGIVITGLPTPGPESRYIYPAELRAELSDRIGEFPVDGLPNPGNLTPAAIFDNYCERHRRRRDAVRYLLGRERWDYCMAVFTFSDKIQHGFWRARERWLQGNADGRHPADVCHPADELVRRFGPAIDQCYDLMDETVGMLLAEAGDEATVLVVSDHGFGPICATPEHLAGWLVQRGFTRLLEQKPWRQRLTSSAYAWLRQRLSEDLKASLRRRLPGLRQRVESGARFGNIDWSTTTAFAGRASSDWRTSS